MPKILGIALLLMIVAGHLSSRLEGEVVVQPVTRPQPPAAPAEASGAGMLDTQRKALEQARQIEKMMQDRAEAISKTVDEQTGAAADDDES